jgi:hypothetical protein
MCLKPGSENWLSSVPPGGTMIAVFGVTGAIGTRKPGLWTLRQGSVQRGDGRTASHAKRASIPVDKIPQLGRGLNESPEDGARVQTLIPDREDFAPRLNSLPARYSSR